MFANHVDVFGVVPEQNVRRVPQHRIHIHFFFLFRFLFRSRDVLSCHLRREDDVIAFDLERRLGEEAV